MSAETIEPVETRIERLAEMLVPTRRGEGVTDGDLVTVARGYRMRAEAWNGLKPEGRHLVRIIAVQRRAVGEPVFSQTSAAVLHGLPLHARADPRVHLTAPENGPGRSTAGVVRHRAPLGSEDVVEIGGLLCTAPDRTLLDLARFGAAETAIACADGFLRQEFRVERRIDRIRLERWRERMLETLADMPGERGVMRAREIVELADPRIDSVLESVSHLYLRRLGFDVELQVPVVSRTGGTYFVDFEFLGLDLFGECDGKAKYLDEALRAGRSADELVYREKRRQDWITGSTRKGMIRWGWPETGTVHRFARHLSACGLRISRPPGPSRPRQTWRG